MKKKVVIFIIAVSFLLVIVPVINLKWGVALQKAEDKWWNRSVLYNLDFALPYLSQVFYSIGISIEPNQVIIGKDDWLYLGDMYAKTITSTRIGATLDDKEAAKKIGVASKAWDQWFKSKDISLYKIMLVPNKNTVYSEFLPDWAQPATHSVADELLSNISPGIYIDTRPALKAAKLEFSYPLYYETGSHWNGLGAWVAFRTFATELARTETGSALHWPSLQIADSKVFVAKGNDLSDFLRMNKVLSYSEVWFILKNEQPVETERYGYDIETGNLTVSDGKPKPCVPVPPTFIKSKKSLNQKKILWLHDSFGWAMSCFMTATFSEILEFHYDMVDSSKLVKLVDSFKPDYVFITVVERGVLSDYFKTLPPTTAQYSPQ